nr:unnamed protein product [Callosobruchus analis]CAI5836322.1 unnamed protein product [Callosobruchus analis]CAI5852721.1 unnamed protein product [Callosobruchus analis]
MKKDSLYVSTTRHQLQEGARNYSQRSKDHSG